MTSPPRTLYICCWCFNASEAPGECHGRALIRVECGPPGEASTRPITTPEGRLATRAPRWWIEQVCRQQFQERGRE